jgi:hypothetical protein
MRQWGHASVNIKLDNLMQAKINALALQINKAYDYIFGCNGCVTPFSGSEP